MSYARVNGVQLYYEEHGTGAPILCVHGGGSTAMAWEAAAADLARLGRVVIYDRRGCARSERPAAYDASVPAHAADAAALLAALAAAPAVVIGRSYGGEIALALAVSRRDLVRALVLLDGAPPALDAEAQEWTLALRAAAERAAANDLSTVAETLYEWVAGAGALASVPEPLRSTLVDNGPAILAELRGPYFRPSERELATVELPTLLLLPAEPLPGMVRATERLAAALPNARTIVVPGGHLISPALPEVLRFVADVLGGARG